MNEIADGIFVETSFEGVNVGAVVTDDALIYIDAPTFPSDARYWVSQIEGLYRGRYRFLVLTDYHGDRIMNCRWFQSRVISHRYSANKIIGYEKRYPQHNLNSLSQRFPNRAKELSTGPVGRPNISFSRYLSIKTGKYDVLLEAYPGPTEGNILVHIPECNILFSGDTIVCSQFPALSEMKSRSWLDTLQVIQKSNYSHYRIIPGRGDLGDISAAKSLFKFVESMRQSVIGFIQGGHSIEKIDKLAAQFLGFFPNEGLPQVWLVREITLGLENIYNELTLNNHTI
jgi:glyoxylase-like metal-dependent hydrolase (beta-lactamase superfamily II)